MDSQENSRPLGRGIAHMSGNLSTAIGTNVADTTATGFLRTVIADTLARATRFVFIATPMVVVAGYPRFQYGGFWFSVVDPWPEYWSDDWYDNDDVYIEYYGDGYYLYNRRFPQDRIAISVSVN